MATICQRPAACWFQFGLVCVLPAGLQKAQMQQGIMESACNYGCCAHTLGAIRVLKEEWKRAGAAVVLAPI